MDGAPKLGRITSYTQAELAKARERLLERGDVLDIVVPDQERITKLREDLDSYEYPKKFKEYVGDILDIVSMPIVRDTFSDEPLRHAERRAWRESLVGSEKYVAEHNLLRTHKLGHAVTYLEAILHLVPVPDDGAGKNQTEVAFMAAQARDKNKLFAKVSPEVPSEYETLDFEGKRQHAEAIRDFLEESIGTLLRLYRRG